MLASCGGVIVLLCASLNGSSTDRRTRAAVYYLWTSNGNVIVASRDCRVPAGVRRGLEFCLWCSQSTNSSVAFYGNYKYGFTEELS